MVYTNIERIRLATDAINGKEILQVETSRYD